MVSNDSIDREIDAMGTIVDAFGYLNQLAQVRVIRWMTERYVPKPKDQPLLICQTCGEKVTP